MKEGARVAVLILGTSRCASQLEKSRGRLQRLGLTPQSWTPVQRFGVPFTARLFLFNHAGITQTTSIRPSRLRRLARV
jgi:hypothetical protein